MGETGASTSKECCPGCGSHNTVRGRIGFGDGSGAEFLPAGLPILKLERSVRLVNGTRLYACIECNLVWSRLVPGQLRGLLNCI